MEMRLCFYSLVVLGTLIAMAAAVSAANDPPNTGGTVTGDWIVESDSTYQNVVITIDHGNLTIKSGITLKLINVTLIFNDSSDGGHSLLVNNKATLHIENSVVKSNVSRIHYIFKIFGKAYINNSHISHMWGDNNSWHGGIQIYSSMVFIGNSTIDYGKTGGISIFNASPTLYNCTIEKNGYFAENTKYVFGVYMTHSKTKVLNCSIGMNWYRFGETHTSYSYRPTYSTHYWNGHYYYGWAGNYYRYEYIYTIGKKVDAYGYGIYIENKSSPLIQGCSIYRNGIGEPLYLSTYTFVQEDPYHKVYLSTYKRMAYKHHGIGIFALWSTINVINTSLSENGFVRSYTYAWGGNYEYANVMGRNIYVYNCTANIINSSLENSSYGIYSEMSAVNVRNCYIHNEGYRYTQAKTYTGIYAGNSTISIYNTSIRSIDNTNYFWLLSKPSTDSMKSLMSHTSTIRIDKCLFYIEDKRYDLVKMYGLYATYKSNINIKNAKFKFKSNDRIYFGWHRENINIYAELQSKINATNVTIEGDSAEIDGCSAIIISMASDMRGNKIHVLNCLYGIYCKDNSKMNINKINVTGIKNYALFVGRKSSMNIVNGNLYENEQSAFLEKNALLTAEDSSFKSEGGCVLTENSTAIFINTSYSIVSIEDSKSSIIIMWKLSVRVIWSDGSPVKNAEVIVSNTVKDIFEGTTDNNGDIGKILIVKEMVMMKEKKMTYTPHRFFVEKGRVFSTCYININSSMDIELDINDNIAPELIIEHPPNKFFSNSTEIEAFGKVADPETGIQSIECSIDWSPWAELPFENSTWKLSITADDGMHILRVRARDIAGNEIEIYTTFEVDSTAPYLKVLTPKDDMKTNQRTVLVSGITDADAIVSVNGVGVQIYGRHFYKNVTLKEGENQIIIEAMDHAGNVRKTSIHVYVDLTPPTITIDNPPRYFVTNINMLLISGNTSGDYVMIRMEKVIPDDNGHFTHYHMLVEGYNEIEVIAYDIAGNKNKILLEVILDTEPPSLTVHTPMDGIYTNNPHITVAGSAESDAYVKVNGRFVNVMNSMFTTVTTLIEGKNIIDVIAEDDAGNINKITIVVYLDTTPPDLIITTPKQSTITNQKVITVSGTVDWDTDVFVNGKKVLTNNFTFTTSVELSEGENYISVKAIDSAGNVREILLTIVLDTKYPKIFLQSPSDGELVRESFVVVEGITEPYALVVINDEIKMLCDETGHFVADWPVEDGMNKIVIKSLDAAGNVYVETVTVEKEAKFKEEKKDDTWILSIAGILIGIGIAFPIVAYIIGVFYAKRRRGIEEIEAEIEEFHPPEYAELTEETPKTLETLKEAEEGAEAKEEVKYEEEKSVKADVELTDKYSEMEATPGEIEVKSPMMHPKKQKKIEEKQFEDDKDEKKEEKTEVKISDKDTEAESMPAETEIDTHILKRMIKK